MFFLERVNFKQLLSVEVVDHLGGEIPAEGGDGDRECVTPAPLLPMYFPIGSSWPLTTSAPCGDFIY